MSRSLQSMCLVFEEISGWFFKNGLPFFNPPQGYNRITSVLSPEFERVFFFFFSITASIQCVWVGSVVLICVSMKDF